MPLCVCVCDSLGESRGVAVGASVTKSQPVLYTSILLFFFPLPSNNFCSDGGKAVRLKKADL